MKWTVIAVLMIVVGLMALNAPSCSGIPDPDSAAAKECRAEPGTPLGAEFQDRGGVRWDIYCLNVHPNFEGGTP